MNVSDLAAPSEQWPSILDAQAALLANRIDSLALLAQSDGAVRDSAVELATEELRSVVEELRTANEELRVQGEQLAEAHGDLERARRRYQDLFDFAPDPILLTDAAGRIEAANLAVSGLVGFARKYVLGKPLVAFIAPEAAPGLVARIRALAGAPVERVAEFETTFRPRRSGPPLTVSVRVRALDGAGTPQSLLWSLRDVSARHDAERELRRAVAERDDAVRTRTMELEALLRIKDALIDGERSDAARLRTEVRRIAQEAVALLQRGGAPEEALIHMAHALDQVCGAAQAQPAARDRSGVSE
jgi:PAS domain S-box-containing protein